MPQPEVSVVVAVGESHYRSIERQLTSLAHQRTDRTFEVIVADNGGRLEMSGGPKVRVVAASSIRGAGHARNVGVSVARGSKILFCDADDLVHPDWVEAHSSALDETAFTAGSLVMLESAAEIEAARAGTWPEPARFSTRLRLHEGVPFGITANVGIRRDAFELVGGFDERYVRAQDVALGLALRERGIEPSFVPHAQVAKVLTGDQGRPALRRAYESGRSLARMHQDFSVGPTARQLVARHVMRTVRSTRTLSPETVLRHALQLLGLLEGLARGAVDHRTTRRRPQVESNTRS